MFELAKWFNPNPLGPLRAKDAHSYNLSQSDERERGECYFISLASGERGAELEHFPEPRLWLTGGVCKNDFKKSTASTNVFSCKTWL